MAEASDSIERAKLTTLLRRSRRLGTSIDCAAIEITGPIYRSAQTRLYVGRVPNPAAPKLLLKVAIDTASGLPEVEFTRRQYQTLSQVAALRVLGAPLRVPQPLAVFADEGVVVQTWIDGKPLDRVLVDGAVSFDRIREWLVSSGEWLGRFHTAQGVGSDRLPLTRLIDDLSDVDAPVTAAIDALTRHAQQLGQRPQLTTNIHCDFKPSNIITAADGVFGIDFHDSDRTSAYFDIAHFLNALVLDVAKSGRISLLRRSAELEAAFMAGYAQAAAPPERAMTGFFAIYDLARYMGTAPKPAGIKDRLKAFVAARIMRRRIADLDKAL